MEILRQHAKVHEQSLPSVPGGSCGTKHDSNANSQLREARYKALSRPPVFFTKEDPSKEDMVI